MRDMASSCSQLREPALSQPLPSQLTLSQLTLSQQAEGRQQEARQGDGGCSSDSAYTGFMLPDLAAGALASSLRRPVMHSCRARPVVGADVGLLAAGLAQLQELEVEPIMRLNTGLASSRGLHACGCCRAAQPAWRAQHRATGVMQGGAPAPICTAAVWKGAVARGGDGFCATRWRPWRLR